MAVDTTPTCASTPPTGCNSPDASSGADGERLSFAGDLAANLDLADRFFDERIRPSVDSYIERAAIAAPPDDRVSVNFNPPELTEMHLAQEGISTIIWATGYALDFGWIDAPLVDELGYPRNTRGVSAIPGLYFVGLLWQHSQASASLVGPALDGPHLVETMNRPLFPARRFAPIVAPTRHSPGPCERLRVVERNRSVRLAISGFRRR